MDVADGRRGPTIRFWEWTRPALVLGANQSVANEIDLDEAARQGFEITRRMSGGGTMLCQPGGTITWSLTLPERLVSGLSFRDSYRALDAWVLDALRGLGVDVEYRPINEIVVPEGKLAGAAQARRRGAVLHHVTMAYDVDPSLVPRLIRIGRESVQARGARSAERTVAPLCRFVSMSLAETVSRLQAAFASTHAVDPAELGPTDWARAEALGASKYETPDWISRLA